MTKSKRQMPKEMLISPRLDCRWLAKPDYTDKVQLSERWATRRSLAYGKVYIEEINNPFKG